MDRLIAENQLSWAWQDPGEPDAHPTAVQEGQPPRDVQQNLQPNTIPAQPAARPGTGGLPCLWQAPFWKKLSQNGTHYGFKNAHPTHGAGVMQGQRTD